MMWDMRKALAGGIILLLCSVVETSWAYDHLEIVTAGGEFDETQSVGFTIIVSARNPDGTVDAGAYPLISFTSSDPMASLPPNSYLSGGQATFNNVILNTPGNQTITVSDFYDPTVLEGVLPLLVHRFVDHFDFDVSSGAKTAGFSFNITIIARDNTDATVTIFSDNVTLRAGVGQIEPVSVLGSNFVNGVANLSVTLYGTDPVSRINAITCTNSISYPGQARPPRGTTENITVNPGTYYSVLLIFPGETLTPGTAPGKTGTVTSQTAGVALSEVRVRAVDQFWNPTTSPPYPTVSFTSTDPLATIPLSTAMTSNSESFSNLILRTAGVQSVTVEESINHQTDVSAVGVNHAEIDHFSFAPIFSPQTTITPFQVTITAQDAFNNRVLSFQEAISLESSTGPYTHTPTIINFTQGAWSGAVHVTKKANNASLTCDDMAGHTGVSNNFTINAGPFSKLLILLPGESYTPGIAPGRAHTPNSIDAGDTVVATIRAVDDYWNQVAGPAVLVPIILSCPTGYIESLDDGGQLSQFGIGDYRIRFRTHQGQRIRAVNGFNTDMDDLSSAIIVHSGPYEQLVLVVPGESLDPGTFEANGKSGTPENQMAGNEFHIQVAATDELWNPIEDAPPYPFLDFASSDLQAVLPPDGEEMNNPIQEYPVTLATVGPKWIRINDTNQETKADQVNMMVTAGPLEHFEFNQIASPQMVGQPIYNVTVFARDAFGNQVLAFNQDITLNASTGEGTFMPIGVTLTNGEWTGMVTIYRSGSEVKLSCHDELGHSGTSNTFEVLAGGYRHLLVLLPGQEYTPGIAPGKRGSPTATMAGTPLVATVRAVDDYWNTVALRPTVNLRTSGYSVIPDNDSQLNASGSKEFQMILRTAGLNEVTVRDVNNTTVIDSVDIFVSPDEFVTLQFLSPGETPDPGSFTGKIGSPDFQTTGVLFDVQARAVDQYWNLVSGINGEHVRLFSSDNSLNDNNPPNQGQSFVNGVIDFSIYLRQAGLVSVTAYDEDDVNKKQTVEINVQPGAYYEIVVPETVVAGPPATFTMVVRLMDPGSGEPVNASHPFAITPFLANHDPTDGTLGITAGILQDGVTIIDNQTYDHVENIVLQLTDNFGREAFSDPITVVPGDIYYVVSVPEEASVGPPKTFPVNVELRDAQTGNLITTEDRSIVISLRSASTGDPGQGLVGVATANLIGGRAFVQQSYTKAENVYILVEDSVGVRGVSPVFPVRSDGYKKVQIIAPGETPLPGVTDDDGKEGMPTTQRAGIPFTVTVRAVDQYWNLADTTNSGMVHLTSSDNSLDQSNPPSQNHPFVNGERVMTIYLSNAGAIEVTASDLSDVEKPAQAVSIQTLEGPTYQIVTPETALVGPPATFHVTVKLVDPATEEPIPASHTFTLTPFLANRDPAHGHLGRTSATLNAGLVYIVDQTYDVVEDIVLRINDDFGREKYSQPIHMMSSGLYYDIVVPESASVGPPSTFPVSVALRDVNTGSVAVTQSRRLHVAIYSANTGMPGVGTSSVNQVNMQEGMASFLQSYTKAENIFIRVSDDQGLSAVSPVFPLRPDGYKKLQLVAPGEALEAGTISATGKSGLPSIQTSEVSFVVTARAVDQYWNLVDVNRGRVQVKSTDGSLDDSNPRNQSAPFVNGWVDFEIVLHQQGQVTVTASDLDNVDMTPQSVDVPVNAATYEVEVPTSAIAGPPATFLMRVKLINSSTGEVISSSNTFAMEAVLANHQPASSQLSVMEGSLNNGIAIISNQAYGTVEDICIHVMDELEREAFSPAIHMESGGLYYSVAVPETATAGPPETFPVAVRLLDANTGELVTNEDREFYLDVYSASSGGRGTGILGVTVGRLDGGQALIQESYTEAEHIYLRVFDAPGLEAVSTPFLVLAGTEATLILQAPQNMEGGQSTPVTAMVWDAQGNVKTNTSIAFSIIDGPGRLSSTTAITNAAGQASVTLTAEEGASGIILLSAATANLASEAQVEVLGPPVTTLSFQGIHVEKEDGIHIKPSTLVELNATSAIGVDTIYYQLDGTGWQIYDQPYHISGEGAHLLLFYAVDLHGCREKVQTSKPLLASLSIRGEINNYPNPFRAGREATTIEYLLSHDADVTITIYDLLGEVVWQEEFRAGQEGGQAGVNVVEWLGTNASNRVVANGGYICSVRWKDQELRRKIAVVK